MKRKQEQSAILTERRRQLTLEWLREHGVVKTTELATAFSVSPMTVRNDLNTLADQGRLLRIHGGAMARESLTVEPSYQEKTSLNVEAKRRIGVAAADLVKDGMAVFIGNGSTTMHLVHCLTKRPVKALRAFTNALNHAMELTHVPNTEVYVLGGYLRGVSLALVGSLTRRGLRSVYFDLAFLGANGLSLEHGVTIPSLEEAETAAEILSRARTKVILADHSKFGVVTHSKIVALGDIDTVITDRGLNAAQRLELDQCSIEVMEV